MKKIIFTLLLLAGLFGTKQISAQAPYKNALGLRLGYFTGLDFKAFKGSTALELILNVPYGRGLGLTGLVEHYGGTGVEHLGYYIGAGAHVYSIPGGKKYDYYKDERSYTTVGLDGVIGLQYTFPEAPIDLSIDWKPAFNISEGPGFYGGDAALSIRYIFGR